MEPWPSFCNFDECCDWALSSSLLPPLTPAQSWPRRAELPANSIGQRTERGEGHETELERLSFTNKLTLIDFFWFHWLVSIKWLLTFVLMSSSSLISNWSYHSPSSSFHREKPNSSKLVAEILDFTTPSLPPLFWARLPPSCTWGRNRFILSHINDATSCPVLQYLCREMRGDSLVTLILRTP